jgi:hypothetical protein
VRSSTKGDRVTIAEYFAVLPYGSIKISAKKMGYTPEYLGKVISGLRNPSCYMARDLVTFSNGQIDINTITIGLKGNHNANK